MAKNKQVQEVVDEPEVVTLDFYEADPQRESVTLAELVAMDSISKEFKFAMRDPDKTHLEQMLIALIDGASFPPITITPTNYGAVPVDGYHRWVVHEMYLRNILAGVEPTNTEPVEVNEEQYAKARGQYTIPATEVTFNSTRDMLEAALRANLAHGLPASGASRTRYALWMLQIDRQRPNRNPKEDMSIREAARRANVKHPMVLKALKRIAESNSKKMKDSLPVSEDELEEATSAEESKDSKEASLREKHMSNLIKAALYFAESDITSTEMKAWMQEYGSKTTKEDVTEVISMLSYLKDAAPHATNAAPTQNTWVDEKGQPVSFTPKEWADASGQPVDMQEAENVQ